MHIITGINLNNTDYTNSILKELINTLTKNINITYISIKQSKTDTNKAIKAMFNDTQFIEEQQFNGIYIRKAQI